VKIINSKPIMASGRIKFGILGKPDNGV